jgi:hypothetical protein
MPGRAIILVLIVVPVLLGGAPATRPATQPVGPRAWAAAAEEYAVYNALLKREYVDQVQRVFVGEGKVGPVVDQVVLADRTFDVRLFQGDARIKPEDDAVQAEDFAYVLDAALRLKDCPAELADEFHDLNLKPALLDAKRFDVPGIKVALIPQDHYDAPIRPSWAGVDDRYPRSNGVSLFSRVAISADGKLAVVHVSTQMSSTFGFGNVFLLRKEKAGWNVIASRLTWIT